MIKDFIELRILHRDESETSKFSNADIELRHSSGKFPTCIIFRVPESILKSDYISPT